MQVEHPGPSSIYKWFELLPDPRINRTKQHSLQDIIIIAICAIICGADSWVAISLFGECKREWFKTFLSLPNGIPSHDTFGRVFSAIDPKLFGELFIKWVSAVRDKTRGEVIAIDGKTLRRSFNRGGKRAAIHMVSAWATKNHMVLGQLKTEDKSNEITAIPKLLNILSMEGCLVTIDAMGCQKKIAKKIIDRGGAYILAVKGNQETLHADIQSYFATAVEAEKSSAMPIRDFAQVEKGHGRTEGRRYVLSAIPKELRGQKEWVGLRSIGMVESIRCVHDKITVDRRYYISSLPSKWIRKFASAVRNHWGIENSLHWVLDVAFHEDQCRIREGYAAENMATLRHIAVNLLKQEHSLKVGVHNKRLNAGWDNDYLLKIILN